MADVFISYSREDKEKIVPIVDGFKSLGLTVWYDVRLLPGDSFDEIIGVELDAAKAILVCWSPVSLHSRWVKTEANLAQDQNTIVPCFVERCVLRPPFNLTHAEDLSGWTGAFDHPGWKKIVEQVGQLVQRPGLVALMDAKASVQLDQLANWAAQFPDDPYASDAWKIWEEKEREHFNIENKSLLEQLGAHIEKQKLILHDKITEYENAYGLWISSRRRANSGNRPAAPNILYGMTPEAKDNTVADLENKLRTVSKKLSDTEMRLAAELNENEVLRKGFTHSMWGRTAFVAGGAALVVGLIGGFLLDEVNNGDRAASPASVVELAGQIKSLTAERDAASKSFADTKAAATATEQRFAQLQSDFDSKLRDANTKRDEAAQDAKNAKAIVAELQRKWNETNRPGVPVNSQEDSAYAQFNSCVVGAAACDTARCVSAFTSAFPNSSYVQRVLQAAENAARICRTERPIVQQPAPTPEPTPQAQAHSAEQAARNFVVRYYNTSSSQGEADGTSLGALYAPQVNFYGKQTSSAEIMREKLAYNARWDQRRFVVRNDSMRVTCDSLRQICRATGYVEWDFKNSSLSKVRRGLSSFEFRVANPETNPKVVGETSKIEERY